MNLFLKNKNLKNIKDLVNIELNNNTQFDRKKYKILVVDDEGFSQKDSLIKLGFVDITVKYKYDNMDEFRAYDIILCDINGVASDLDPYFQGASLAVQIKEMYPNKYIVIFSALDQSLEFVDYYKKVDNTIIKNLNGNQLSVKLDEFIGVLNSPKYKWESIKKVLEQNDISTYDISFVEHYYVLSILEKKDYNKEISKILYKNSKLEKELINKLVTYVLEIMKGVVIFYATK